MEVVLNTCLLAVDESEDRSALIRALTNAGLLVESRTTSESAAEYLQSNLEACDAIVADIRLFSPMPRAAYDSTFDRIRLVLVVQKGYGGIDWSSLPRGALLLPAPLQMAEFMMLLS